MFILLSLSLLFGAASGEVYLNMAPDLGVSTSDSSYSQFTGPEKAIDGNTNGRFKSYNVENSVHISKTAGSSTFLKITFPSPVYIDHITVWTRIPPGWTLAR